MHTHSFNPFLTMKTCRSGTKIYTCPFVINLNLERTSNSSQSTRPVERVLWEELLESEGEKSEGETSIF